jgi:predicted nucleic acid-binding protein
MIVADTGPMIACARLGRLDLLRDVIGELIIADVVYEARVGREHERPGATEVAQGEWIRRRAVMGRPLNRLRGWLQSQVLHATSSGRRGRLEYRKVSW